MSATGCTRPELVVDQHHRDHGGVGADGGGHVVGAHDAGRRGRDHVDGESVRLQRVGAAHDGRVLQRGHDQVAAARGARRPQHAHGVGLGAAAGEQDLLGLDLQRGRDLAARRRQRARRRRPGAVGRGGVGVELCRGAAHGVQDLCVRLRRRRIVEIHHNRTIERWLGVAGFVDGGALM